MHQSAVFGQGLQIFTEIGPADGIQNQVNTFFLSFPLHFCQKILLLVVDAQIGTEFTAVAWTSTSTSSRVITGAGASCHRNCGSSFSILTVMAFIGHTSHRKSSFYI
jgi:hypothetical protein